MLNKYDDFYFNLITEKILNKEIPLVLSKRFLSVLNKIDHPISDELKSMNKNNDNTFKLSYVDLDESGYDKISFSTSTKSIETISKYYSLDDNRVEKFSDTDFNTINNSYKLLNDLFNKNRSITTIGKLVNKLFPKKYEAKDVESFVNQFKSKRDVNSYFELVSGEDIKHWYHEDQYFGENGTLNGSCMKYDECQDYIDFYAINPHAVSLLILKSDKKEDDEDDEESEKIVGRALIWKLSQPSGRTFMDRIYYTKDHYVEHFKNYAKEKGWLYKKNQNMSNTEYIVDPKDDSERRMSLVVRQMDNSGEYPYMDTLKYYDYDYEVLSNEKNMLEGGTTFFLEETNGSFSEEESGIWVEYYGEYIDEDELIYCDLGDEFRREEDVIYLDHYDKHATEDYVENYMISCDYYDGFDSYRYENDTVSVYGTDEYACADYAVDNMIYSDYLGEYLPEDDDVWSDHHNSYLYRPESIEVYTDAEKYNTDWRDDSDGTWFEGPDGEYYDNDVELDEDDDE